MKHEAVGNEFSELYEIIRRLRAPDGCPWDREQTPESLRSSLLEETWEAIEAIQEGDHNHVREELGDLYMLVTLVGYIYEQKSEFSVRDCIREVSEKLVRRHPHVFADASAETPEEVVRQWNDIKTRVEGRAEKNSVLDKVSKGLPPLERGFELQKKAAKVGFDWDGPEGVFDKIAEEIAEVREAVERDNPPQIEEELGDLMFAVVNLARKLRVDPSLALQRSSKKFEARFRHIESSMKQRGLELSKENLAEMELLWGEAKSLGL